MIKIPDFYEPYKMYSEEDACIEICHSEEYTLEDALKFVESLGYKIKVGGYKSMGYDDWMGDWRGNVEVVV